MSINIRCTPSSEGELINSYIDAGYSLTNREQKEIAIAPGHLHTRTVIDLTFTRQEIVVAIAALAALNFMN